MNYSRDEINEIRRRLKTRHQKVLFRLWIALLKNEVFFLDRIYHQEPISGGWLPNWALRGPLIGGDSSDRRKRELASDYFVPFKQTLVNGHLKDYKVHRWVSDPGRVDYLYCLDIDPYELDWDELFETWPNWVYHHNVVKQVYLEF